MEIKKIENLLDKQEKRAIVFNVGSIIVSALIGFLISYYFFSGITISSSEDINNNTITIKFKNENFMKPTSKLVIFGWDYVNGELILDSLTRGELKAKETVSRTYPIESEEVLINYADPASGKITSKDITTGGIFIRNTLLYKVTCVGCEGQDYWRPLREDVVNEQIKCNFSIPDCKKYSYTQLLWKK